MKDNSYIYYIDKRNNNYLNSSKSVIENKNNYSRNLDLIFKDPIKKDYYFYLDENSKKLNILLSEIIDQIELYKLKNSELYMEIDEFKKYFLLNKH